MNPTTRINSVLVSSIKISGKENLINNERQINLEPDKN